MEYIARPKKLYKEKIVPAMMEEFGYKSVMQVPRLEKIVLSQGLGDAVQDKKIVDYAVEELTAITGQKAVGTISKKDEASFKLRRGNASPTIEAMFEEHTSFFSFPTTDSNVYLTDCEYLITSLGGIMFTSLQMKHRKMSELPDTFIVFAKTSQMVKDITEGMRGLNKRYPANQKPTGLITLQSFFEDPEKSSIATYGTSNKKTYLILLEDLTN